jgi:hypothetical protein
MITGDELIRGLMEAGVIPDKCIRVIIDLEVSKPAQVLYQVYGGPELLNVDLPSMLKANGITGVSSDA